MKIRAFITHKKAEHFHDCQDRFSINCDTKSVAVSDGMSQSWQQKIWAELLVNTFCKEESWVPNLESVRELSPVWKENVEKYIQELKDNNAKESLIYRNERNLAEGKSAGATLVGVRFNGNNWECDVLGDSCLVAKIDNKYKFVTSQDTEKFDNHPDYYDSDSKKQGKGELKNYKDTLSQSNPFVFLVSDPFSDFLLEHNKKGDIEEYVKQLLLITNHEEFEKLVADWRLIGMHNDDSTLVIIEYDGSDEWNIMYQDNLSELLQTNQNVMSVPMITPKEEKEESSISQDLPISKEEFCEELIRASESIFVFSPIFDWIRKKKKKERREKLEEELREVAEKLYDQFKILKKD